MYAEVKNLQQYKYVCINLIFLQKKLFTTRIPINTTSILYRYNLYSQDIVADRTKKYE